MFSKLLNIGVYDGLEFYQKRETKILNLFSIITIVGSLIGTINVYFLGQAYPAFVVITEIATSVLIILFNKEKKFQSAAYTFVISINLTLLYLNLYYDGSTGSYLYYFPLIFCIALLYNPNKSKIRAFVFFTIVLLSFLSGRFFKFPHLGSANLTPFQNTVIFNFNINLVAVLTVVLVYLVINMINKQYLELSDLLKKSQEDQITIQNSLKEKDILFSEIQHRVKNNLSVIIGLFNLQKENSSNEETKQHITEAKNRVLSIAMVHERLYRTNISKINLKNYISELTKEVVRSHPLHDYVTVKENLEDLEVDITKAVPIGLVINEVITNSLKHGFVNTQVKPVINISVIKTFDLICIKLEDNGKGFPENKTRSEKSLGLSLIESLADQIDGNIYYSNNEGATVKLSLPF